MDVIKNNINYADAKSIDYVERETLQNKTLNTQS